MPRSAATYNIQLNAQNRECIFFFSGRGKQNSDCGKASKICANSRHYRPFSTPGQNKSLLCGDFALSSQLCVPSRCFTGVVSKMVKHFLKRQAALLAQKKHHTDPKWAWRLDPILGVSCLFFALDSWIFFEHKEYLLAFVFGTVTVSYLRPTDSFKL